MATKRNRSPRRPDLAPPSVTVRDLRKAAGLTLDQACALYADHTGSTISRGHMAAIETGTRGVSQELLDALAAIYGSRLVTDYRPRASAV